MTPFLFPVVPEIIGIGLEVAHHIFCFDKNPPPLPEKPILELLISPHAFEPNTRQAAYDWSELTHVYVKEFPAHAVRIFQSILEHFTEHLFAVNLVHSQAQKAVVALLKHDLKGCWQVIEERLVPLYGTLSSSLIYWLGPAGTFGEGQGFCPLSLFAIHDIFSWVDADPKERVPYIARACPKTLSPTEGGELSRQLLIKYGNQRDVAHALACNFASEGWSGKASDHFRNMREKMRSWLHNETSNAVMG